MIAAFRIRLMLHLFERDPQQVRWELASLGSGSCRLVVHHSQGTIVETFASTEQALRRVQQLEDYPDHARVPPHAKANAARATIQQTRAVSIESPLGNRDEPQIETGPISIQHRARHRLWNRCRCTRTSD